MLCVDVICVDYIILLLVCSIWLLIYLLLVLIRNVIVLVMFFGVFSCFRGFIFVNCLISLGDFLFRNRLVVVGFGVMVFMVMLCLCSFLLRIVFMVFIVDLLVVYIL